jgi:hypothetical protein
MIRMKITLKILAFVLALAFVSSSCKKNDPTPPSAEDQQLAKLTATWKASSVTFDASGTGTGVAQTGYDNFTLTISGTAGASSFGYTTTGRPSTSPWPASGTWTFGTDPLIILRDDNITMNDVVSDTQLQLTFDFKGVGYPSSRTANVAGTWVFNFTKQ